MNNGKTIEELIEGYNTGVLDPSEIHFVEEKMLSEASFAESVELDKNLREVVFANAFADLRTQMNHDLSKIERSKSVKTKLIMAAIGIALMTLIGVVLMQNEDGDFPEPVEVSKPMESVIEKKDKSEVVIDSVISEKKSPVKPETIISNTYNNQSLQVKPLLVDTVSSSRKKVLPVDVKQNSEINEPVQKDKETPLLPLPCALTFGVETKPSCVGEYTGSVSVNKRSLEGATLPVNFELGGIVNSTGYFEKLSSGHYSILLSDANNCSLTKSIEILEVQCLPKEISFNPSYGEKAELKVADVFTKMQVLNRAREVVFKTEFDVDSQIEWSGKSVDGTILPTGLYICVLQYENGKNESVQISILK